MFNQVNRKSLKNNGNEKAQTIDKQLGLILEHIDDLKEVNERVQYSEKEENYKYALPSDKSSIRFDF